MSSEDEHEAGVDDDFTEVVRTGDEGEEWSWRYGVSVGTLELELSKYLVRLELMPPGDTEHCHQDPWVSRHWGEADWGCDGRGGSDKARSFTNEPCGCTEVVSKPNNVVSDVHGGGAGLVDEQALVESPGHLTIRYSDEDDEDSFLFYLNHQQH